MHAQMVTRPQARQSDSLVPSRVIASWGRDQSRVSLSRPQPNDVIDPQLGTRSVTCVLVSSPARVNMAGYEIIHVTFTSLGTRLLHLTCCSLAMRFAQHLSSHLTPEWRKHYIDYDKLKKMIYEMVGEAVPVDDEGQSGHKNTLTPCLML